MAAGAVGDADDADPPGRARVAVGGEADAGLVRQRDDLQPARPPEAQEEAHDQVAGNAEEVRDADLLQVGDEEVAERHARLHRRVFTGVHRDTET